MNDQLLSLLGIARRAGRLSLGFDVAAEVMTAKKSSLLILANDLSERTLKNIKKIAEQSKTPTIVLDIPMNRLGAAVGKSTGIISVNDKGFAEKIKTLCAE